MLRVDRIYFETKCITMDEEGHCDKKINLTPRQRKFNCIQQSFKIYEVKVIELKGKTDNSTFMVGEFHPLFSATNRTTRQNQQRH